MTLVEMLLGQLLGVLIIGGLLSLVPPAIALLNSNNAVSLLQENARLGVDSLDRLIQQAGYGGCHTGKNHAAVIRQDAPGVSQRLANWAFHRFMIRGLDAAEVSEATALFGRDWINSRYQFADQPVGDLLLVQSSAEEEWELSVHRPEVQTLVLDTATSYIAPGTVLRIADCQHSATFQVAGSSVETVGGYSGNIRISYGAEDSANCTSTLPHPWDGAGNELVLLGAGAATHCGEDNPGSGFLPYQFPAGSQVMPLASTLLYIGRHRDTGEPGLYRMDIARSSARHYTEAIVEGVENMRFLYGIDDDADGSPNRWLVASGVNQYPDQWDHVVAVQTWLLLRTPIGRGRAKHTHSLHFPDNRGDLVDCRTPNADPGACPFDTEASAEAAFFRRVIERTFYLRNRVTS